MSASWALSLLAFGVLVSAYGSITGAGGGFLIVPALLLTHLADPQHAAGTSLVVVACNTLSASIAYVRQRRADVKSSLWMAAVSAPGSLLGAHLTGAIEGPTFRVVFGALLVAVSLWLVASAGRPVSRKEPRPGWGVIERRFVDAHGHEYRYAFALPPALAVSALLGVLSSALGIGGGVIMVPVMVHALGFPAHVATATSQLALALYAPVGAVTHAIQGHVEWGLALFLGIGAIIGGQLGARIAPRLRGPAVLRLLALALLLTGARVVWQGVQG